MQAKAPGAASDVFLHRHSSGRFRAPASFAPASRNSTTRASRARLALRLNPLRRFSRRRKRRPHPVLLLKRRRRIGRGDHSPLPRETSLGQFAGRPIVEAVVRSLADSDQIPAAPLPAWEILNRVDMVHCRRGFVAAIAASLAALGAVAPQDCISQAQPSFALVVRLGSPPFHPAAQIKQSAMTSRRRSWRSCHPAITSAAKQKRQTIYRSHGQIIWRRRWRKGSGSGSYSRLRWTRVCTPCSTAGSLSALSSAAHAAASAVRTAGRSVCRLLTPIVYHARFCFARLLFHPSDYL